MQKRLKKKKMKMKNSSESFKMPKMTELRGKENWRKNTTVYVREEIKFSN